MLPGARGSFTTMHNYSTLDLKDGQPLSRKGSIVSKNGSKHSKRNTNKYRRDNQAYCGGSSKESKCLLF